MERVADLLPDIIDTPATGVVKEENLNHTFSNNNSERPNALDLWSKGARLLQDTLDDKIFAAWIKPLGIAGLNYSSAFYRKSGTSTDAVDAEIILSAPNKFSRDHIEKNYGTLISETLSSVLGTKKTSVYFKVLENTNSNGHQSKPGLNKLNDNKGVTTRKPAASPKRAARPNSSRNDNINPKYNFANYVVGSCNQFAHAVSVRVAEDLGFTYNPLFIYGGVGLGKTHLANAIGNATRRRGKKVLLVSSELFVSELIASLRSNNMTTFKSKFRSLDLLIVDDIQFLIGKERTQEEFFHTFNELHQRHKQIIITSDKVPQELVGLEERLRTRFASGIAVDLQAPDFETRVAILNKKSESCGVTLPDGVSGLIANRIDTNVRELEGALNRLIALSTHQKRQINEALADEVIRSVSPGSLCEITTDAIQKVVAERYNVSLGDLIGKRRTQNIAHARQVAMYLCRKLTGCSYPEIGALFGGRDHSTVIHAKKVVEERISATTEFKLEVESLEKHFIH